MSAVCSQSRISQELGQGGSKIDSILVKMEDLHDRIETFENTELLDPEGKVNLTISNIIFLRYIPYFLE